MLASNIISLKIIGKSGHLFTNRNHRFEVLAAFRLEVAIE